MGYILVERDLQETALKDTKPAVIQKEEWDKKNDKAKALIRVNMSDFGTQEYFDCRNRLGSLGSQLGLLYEAKFLNLFLRQSLL